MMPVELTLVGWHRAQSGNAMPVCCGSAGGAPWQDPQNTCEVPSVHTGVRSLAAESADSFAPPPWQYELEQERAALFHTGVAPSRRASPENVSVAGRG